MANGSLARVWVMWVPANRPNIGFFSPEWLSKHRVARVETSSREGLHMLHASAPSCSLRGNLSLLRSHGPHN